MQIMCCVIGSAYGHSYCKCPEDQVTMAIVRGICGRESEEIEGIFLVKKKEMTRADGDQGRHVTVTTMETAWWRVLAFARWVFVPTTEVWKTPTEWQRNPVCHSLTIPAVWDVSVYSMYQCSLSYEEGQSVTRRGDVTVWKSKAKWNNKPVDAKPAKVKGLKPVDCMYTFRHLEYFFTSSVVYDQFCKG